MNIYLRLLKTVTLLIVVGCGIQQQSAYAGWFGKMKNELASKMQYHIRVLDDQNRPIAGAALWWSNIDDNDSTDWAQVMNRLFERYSADYDYARPLNLMTSRMIVEYVNAGGEADWEWKTSLHPKMVFAVLKRGYAPSVVVLQPTLNKKQELVFRLKKNPADIVDSRMDVFDGLRGDIFNSTNMGMMTDERETYIQNKQQEIRKIAASLEMDKPELAARVYLNLADLPSVDVFHNPDGSISGKGFTNGYDENSKERVTDFEKGLSLDVTTPEIQARKITRQEYKDKIRFAPKDKKIPRMHSSLNAIREIISASPNRVWPNTHIWLVYRFDELEDYTNACDALKKAYLLEPASQTKDDWIKLADDISRSTTKLGLPSCKLSF